MPSFVRFQCRRLALYLADNAKRMTVPNLGISTQTEPLREGAVLSHLLSENLLGSKRLLGRL